MKHQERQTRPHCGRADLDDGSGNCGSNGAQQMWTVAGRVDGGCGTMATALAAATAHSTWGRWQRTAAVELDAAGRTNGERLLLWTTAAAVAAATAHSNCGRRQLTAAVEWDAAGRTKGERLLLWTTVAAETAVAVPAVAVTVMAADSNWGRSCLWLGAVHIWRKWQMAVSTEI